MDLRESVKNILLSAALVLALAACSVMPTPVIRATGQLQPIPSATATRRPTRTPGPTDTPAPLDTPTFPPSATLKPALPATPTLPFALLFSTPTLTATATVLSGSPAPPTVPIPLDCKLMWQSPPNGSTYVPGEKFSVGWNLKNVGTSIWEASSFEFTYLDGARMATHDSVVPLRQNVPPGGTVVLSLPMRAPMNSSTYTTHWGIRQGKTYFCRLTLTIQVSS